MNSVLWIVGNGCKANVKWSFYIDLTNDHKNKRFILTSSACKANRKLFTMVAINLKGEDVPETAYQHLNIIELYGMNVNGARQEVDRYWKNLK